MELTNASNDLINAQSSYVQAILSLVNAQVGLEKFLNN
jgi:outer membrane protein TolC